MDMHSTIRERAYMIWEQEGRPQGRDLHHWLRAEGEVSRFPRAERRGLPRPTPRVPNRHWCVLDR